MNSRRSIQCLRSYGALARTDLKEVLPRVDYALTPLGRSLADAIVPLCTVFRTRLVLLESRVGRSANSLPQSMNGDAPFITNTTFCNVLMSVVTSPNQVGCRDGCCANGLKRREPRLRHCFKLLRVLTMPL